VFQKTFVKFKAAIQILMEMDPAIVSKKFFQQLKLNYKKSFSLQQQILEKQA